MVVHKGALWLRMGRDLLQLDARSGEVLHRWPGLDADPRFVDGLGNVWLMATNDLEIRVTVPGLLDPVERKVLGMSPRLGFYGNVTSAQALDQDGTIWLGTFDKGLARLRPSRVETYDQRHGLPHRAVSAVHGGPGLGLWVQTDHGVARRVGDRFEAWTKSSIPTKRSLLALDSETALVAGDQLQRFAAGKEPEVIGPDVSGVSLVGKDRGGRWVVGNGETLWRESAAGQWFEERGTPTNRSWHSWEEGRRGEVFLGTVGRGLFHRPPGGAWESVNLPGNPSAAAVLWWEDGWRPWLGSQTGLYRLRRPAADSLTYIGQGQVGGRVRAHLAKAQQPGHAQQSAFTGSLELSWVDLPDLPRRTLLEYENDLIAGHVLTQGRQPVAQFLG
jgi:hypothetical protein